jgi:hypothetical protein
VSILVPETLLAITLSDVQWDRLSRTPLITSLSIGHALQFRNLMRERYIIDRPSINVESFLIEGRFWYHEPFEYKYEYACPDELFQSLAKIRAIQKDGAGENSSRLEPAIVYPPLYR